MKRFLTLILAATMLLSCLSISAFAQGPDMQFSIKGAKGKPTETVKIPITLETNPGTWAAYFKICFDTTALKLVGVENGEVFKDSEFTKAPMDNDGYYIYFGSMNDPQENNMNTGLIVTAEFAIKETASNGYYDVWLEFPDHGEGWFFDANDLDNDRSVPNDKEIVTQVTVVGSSVVGETETDSKGVIVETKDISGKELVTDYVTDASGKIVKNDKGEYETYVVDGKKKSDIPVYKTDENGELVTDEDGNYETYYVDEEGNVVSAPEETTAKEKVDENEEKRPIHKALVIAAIAAVVVAAVIIVVVVVVSKKNTVESQNTADTENKEENSESNKEDNE